METLNKENLTGKNNETPYANLPLHFLTASSITGDKVFNSREEHLGNIKDVMIDVVNGKIEYVIIEFGSFLGFGGKYFAIPYSKFKIDTHKKSFIIDQEKSVFENAPGFDKDHWPETNSHYYQKSSLYWDNYLGPVVF